MDDIKSINKLIQTLEYFTKREGNYGTIEITVSDARQLKVFLYDLKLYKIKERDK